MTRASALRSSVARGTLLRVAILTAVGAFTAASPADAQYYWRGDSEPGYYGQQVVQPPRHPVQARRGPAKKEKAQVKDTSVHPQMPLIVNVSIAQQKVRVYDANGFFAEAPVSTGMPGHATPMGVFSVIQKDRYHHSNIYSGAPMPFMQRITWSGIALHAGVLPGYPASHGCIRMPEAFAVKMWGWTKMGARVIVTPGELSPESFSHALLPTLKVMPEPPVAEQPQSNEPVAAKADKGAPDLKPIEASLELRSTVGHSDNIQPLSDTTTLRDQTHTADASGEVQASSSAANSTSDDHAPAASKPDASNPDSMQAADAAKDDAAQKTPTNNASADATKPAEAAATQAKPEDVASVPEAKPATATVDAAKADTPPPASKPEAATPDAAKTEAAKPVEPVKAANDATPADVKKDQTRIADPIKPVAKPEKKREGQIAVFISRKDSKIYVRQNFAPLFESPVTIAPSDRPLGTHIFTAEFDKNDSNALHWSVVNVPMSARGAMASMRDSDMPRASRHQKGQKGRLAPAVEAKPTPVPDSPAEALDRITIPPDVMQRITDALTTGASIIVSDQGINQGETGEGTDFIVSLR